MDFLEQAKQQKMGMRFGTWNVRGVCRSGSLKTVPRELPKYKLHLEERQEVKKDKGGIEPADAYTFLYGNENVNNH